MQRSRQIATLGLFQHSYERAQLHPVWMRLDGLGLGRQHLGSARKMLDSIAVGEGVKDLAMRIGDGRLVNVVVDRVPPFLINPHQLDLHARAVRLIPVSHGIGDDLRRVFARVDLNLVVVRRLA